MEMKESKRCILIEALNCLIEEKKYEIKEIKVRTEDDYKQLVRLKKKLGSKPFCLEEVKQKDVERVEKKIKEIEEVKNEVNDGKSRLLLVPNYIQLQLIGK